MSITNVSSQVVKEYHKCKSKVRRVKATYLYKWTNYHASMLRLGLRCKVYPEEDAVLRRILLKT